MKKLLTILLSIIICLCFTACSSNSTDNTPSKCTHIYSSATCTLPQKCSKCGTTKGSALGHNYSSATCTSPKQCVRCSQTSGSALGHTTTTGVCSRCDIRQGWSKSEVRNLIQIRSVYVDDINSAGGVDMEIQWKNTSNKTIKYIYFDAKPYNAVGDIVPCEIRGYKLFTGYCTGPFEPEYTSWWYYDGTYYGGSHWSNCWYNNSVKTISITEIRIIYTDNTKETIAGNFVDYAFYS